MSTQTLLNSFFRIHNVTSCKRSHGDLKRSDKNEKNSTSSSPTSITKVGESSGTGVISKGSKNISHTEKKYDLCKDGAGKEKVKADAVIKSHDVDVASLKLPPAVQPMDSTSHHIQPQSSPAEKVDVATTQDFNSKNRPEVNCGLSDYEKLRLRNIKRNHDRLVKLGLADPSSDPTLKSRDSNDHEPSKQNSKRRKTIKKAKVVPTAPPRRSTRKCKRGATSRDENIINDEDHTSTKQIVDVQNDTDIEEPCELFQDSPLVQYNMGSARYNQESPISNENKSTDEISTLVPSGLRLSAPKANHAIYSIDIFNGEDESTSTGSDFSWIVGAGKSGIISMWNAPPSTAADSKECPEPQEIEPVMTWKGHGGRWIADAKFVPFGSERVDSLPTRSSCPSHLITAANDGCVCLWDVRSTSCRTGLAKCISVTGKNLHKSGIFSMDVSKGTNYDDIYVCTGSKDKTLAVSTLNSVSKGAECQAFFVSNHHTAKVGCVTMQGLSGSTLIGSASDDGSVAIHDFRSKDIAHDLDGAHDKPHSVVWHPKNENMFITAGFDDTIHAWDLRSMKKPWASFSGHVPLTSKACKRIYRPAFLTQSCAAKNADYILTGSNRSNCLSMFRQNFYANEQVSDKIPVFSRGYLPDDCGDVGSCVVNQRSSTAAIAIDGGEIIVLRPQSKIVGFSHI
uniref:Uncharacterized protein n=1 Tax=Chaetoceros debilis TaxID=122233 RepID=A0A7S3QAH8_9STRA